MLTRTPWPGPEQGDEEPAKDGNSGTPVGQGENQCPVSGSVSFAHIYN